MRARSFTDTTDVASAGFAAQVVAAVVAAEAAHGSSEEAVNFTLGGVGGILTNEINAGFSPEGKYLTADNDVVDITAWDNIYAVNPITGEKYIETYRGNVNISDAFSSDNDKVVAMASAFLPGQTGELKLASVENLEIINAGTTAEVFLTGSNFKGLEAIKVKGDATNLSVADFTYGVKIDATENADLIYGGSKNDTINGGAGNDTIQGNKGDDVLTGGNGADTFRVGYVDYYGTDQILDFSAEDKIVFDTAAYAPEKSELKKLDASTFSVVNYKTLDSVLATFAIGGANETKAGDVVIFSYDGTTYALLSATNGFDVYNSALVDITGANVASLTESNFDIKYNGFGPIVTSYDYDTYNDFTTAAAGYIPDGVATIKSITNVDAAKLALDKALLAKIAPAGIAAITGGDVAINMSASDSKNFDATEFDAKLADTLTGFKVNITGTNANETITASKFGGSINGGKGSDVLTAGSGTDTFVFDTGDSTSATPDTVNGFVSGTDKIDLSNNPTNKVQYTPTATDLAGVLTELAANSKGDGSVAVQTFTLPQVAAADYTLADTKSLIITDGTTAYTYTYSDPAGGGAAATLTILANALNGTRLANNTFVNKGDAGYDTATWEVALDGSGNFTLTALQNGVKAAVTFSDDGGAPSNITDGTALIKEHGTNDSQIFTLANDVAYFTLGEDTYVAQAALGAGATGFVADTDLLVKLAGVTALDATTDII